MRAVVQPVSRASVAVEGRIVGEIGPGLLVLRSVSQSDAKADADYLAEKIAGLRIKRNQGHVKEMVQAWRRTHFIYDQAGTRHDYIEVEGQQMPVHLVPDAATLCWHTSGPSGVDTFRGVDTYVSMSVADDLTSFRTKGRPCEWEGRWDRLSLRNPPPPA